jgi:hypothetical protein
MDWRVFVNSETDKLPVGAGHKTRAKLKLLDGISAIAVMLLIIEFWLFSENRFGAMALWLLVAVILAVQLLKLRLRCPSCSAGIYRGWRYSYRSKVPDQCKHCSKPLP